MESSQKKNSIIIIGMIVVLGIIISLLWYKGVLGSRDRKYFLKIKNAPDLVVLYNQGVIDQKKIDAEPENQELYLRLGIDWKSIAEQSNDEKVRKYFLQKSLNVYEKGAEMFGSKNVIFSLNAGNVARELGDYAKAEQQYQIAIKKFSADPEAYFNLTDLYMHELHSSPDKIIEVFNQGIKSIYDVRSLLQGRAEYLKKIGNYKAALDDYKVLLKTNPKNTVYQSAAAELETLLKKK